MMSVVGQVGVLDYRLVVLRLLAHPPQRLLPEPQPTRGRRGRRHPPAVTRAPQEGCARANRARTSGCRGEIRPRATRSRRARGLGQYWGTWGGACAPLRLDRHGGRGLSTRAPAAARGPSPVYWSHVKGCLQCAVDYTYFIRSVVEYLYTKDTPSVNQRLLPPTTGAPPPCPPRIPPHHRRPYRAASTATSLVTPFRKLGHSSAAHGLGLR